MVRIIREYYALQIDGSSIRVITDTSSKTKQSAGIVRILPTVQIIIGMKLDDLKRALAESRVPVALQIAFEDKGMSTYNVTRMETGSIGAVTLGYVQVYNGYIVAYRFNKSILSNTKIKKQVQLSALHQFVLCKASDNQAVLKAVEFIGTITGIDRDRMVVLKTSKSIKIRIQYHKFFDRPIYYVFTLTKDGNYVLTQIGYDIEELAKAVKI